MEEKYISPNGNRSKPDNFLVWSILSTVLCCVPLGIVAIIYSSKVDNLWSAGNYSEAEEAAKKAKTFTLVGAGISLFFWIIYIILIATGVVAGVFSDF